MGIHMANTIMVNIPIANMGIPAKSRGIMNLSTFCITQQFIYN